MTRFRSLPVEVTAVQYRRGAADIPGVEGIYKPIVRTRSGAHSVYDGDWVVTHPDGEREVVADVDFRRRFAPVTEPAVGTCCRRDVPDLPGAHHDGTRWTCPTCGVAWVHICDEAEGCSWLPAETEGP